MTLRTLQDSAVLAPLARAAERVGVEAVLFGSVASRAMLFDAAGAPARDLFELAEHVSDIDIGHNGPAHLTPVFEEAIALEVPMAPWFRWSVTDLRGLRRQEHLAQYNVGLPLRQLWLSTRPLADPDSSNGVIISRALRGDLDLFANANFGSSVRAASDTEASAVLVHLDATIDVIHANLRRNANVSFVPGTRQPAEEIVRLGIARLANLEMSRRAAALRRLWYRLAGSALRLSPGVFGAAVKFFGLEPIIDSLDDAGYPASRLISDDGASIIVSGHLKADMFRVPTLIEKQEPFENWTETLNRVLADMSVKTGEDGGKPVTLSPGNQVVTAVRSVHVRQGVSVSSKRTGPLAHEFVHFGLHVPSEFRQLHADRLTAVVVGHGANGPSLLPAFSSVSTSLSDESSLSWPRPGSERCTVRINYPGLANDLHAIDIYLVRAL